MTKTTTISNATVIVVEALPEGGYVIGTRPDERNMASRQIAAVTTVAELADWFSRSAQGTGFNVVTQR